MTRQGFLAGLLTPLLTPAVPDAVTDRARMEDFCDLFYHQKRVRAAFEAHVTPDYIQHSLGIGQGREAAIVFLEPMFARPDFILRPERIMIDGDMVTVILNVTAGTVRAIVVDLFRLKDGKVVEHWDVKSELAPDIAGSYFAGFTE